MAKILIVEDDPLSAELINDLLSHQQHTVELTNDGQDGAYRVQNYRYDLIILDWGLPGLAGVEICRLYRASAGTGLVLMLTGRSATDDKEFGLDSGADDYLTKPFQGREFLARVRALLRRQDKQLLGSCLTVENIKLDINSRKVWLNTEELSLLPLEFAVLEFLLKHPNQVLSYERLISAVWSSESESTSSAVRKCVERLRKKIDRGKNHSVIETVHGIGYVLRN